MVPIVNQGVWFICNEVLYRCANFALVFANDEDDRERVQLLHTENLMESAGSLKELAGVMEYTKRNPPPVPMPRTPRHMTSPTMTRCIFNGRVIPVVGAVLDGLGAVRAGLLVPCSA